MSKEFDEKVTEFFKNYQDRGMKKWQGFILSDHNVAMYKQAAKDKMVFSKKSTMTQSEISEKLMCAFANNYVVVIQINELNNNGNYLPDIVGNVLGYQDNQVIVADRLIDIEDINNVELIE